MKSYEQIRTIRSNIRDQLRQVIQRYAPSEQSYTWQVLDMLTEEADYEQRRQLEQWLLLLRDMRLLMQEPPQKIDIAMRIIFKQDDVVADQLKIDLSRLRLVERHGESKLELMKAY